MPFWLRHFLDNSDSEHGNVLSIIGEDVINSNNHLNRAGLKTALISRYPNIEGQVDFIVCFVPSAPPPSNFAGIDHTLSPRPLRGIVEMAGNIGNLTLERIAGIIGGGIAHEIGHYKKKHIIKSMIISILHMGIMFYLLSIFLNHKGLFEAFYMQEMSIYAGLIFFGMLYSPVEMILSVFIGIIA